MITCSLDQKVLPEGIHACLPRRLFWKGIPNLTSISRSFSVAGIFIDCKGKHQAGKVIRRVSLKMPKFHKC